MCKMTEKTTQRWLQAVAIIMIILSVSVLSAGISGVMSPFLKYNNLNYYVLIMCLLAFLFILAGGILGCIGVKKHRGICIHLMFWFLLFSTLWTLGVAGNMYGLYQVYVSRDAETGCGGAMEHYTDIAYVGDTVGNNLCSANCLCDSNGIDTDYISISGNTGGSAKKVQDCTAWRSEFDNIGDVLAQLENTYKCTGFCSTKNYFRFSDISKLPIQAPCYTHMDKYVAWVAGDIGGTLYGTSFVLFLMLLILFIVAGSQSRYQTFDTK